MSTRRTEFAVVNLRDGKLAREFPRPRAASAKPVKERIRYGIGGEKIVKR